MGARQPNPENRKANRLAGQSSPYLLQHRFNPVDWFPWGPEAFAEARKRGVPIFLSIGYSTCYWCHVMERESFESADIAAIMNENYVCIKVDREERPDVDDIYMAAVQAFSGHGGWPMSLFLEPASLKPFFAGTYFPSEPKFAGTPTFPQVLRAMSQAWKDHRDDVLKQADELADAVRERIASRHEPVRLSQDHVTQAVTALVRMHDRTWGGFGPAPEFPQPVFLDLLLQTRAAAGDQDTRDALDAALTNTLDHMAIGGIFDQVGGGFRRYSTDEKWLVPHFEKMLYDQGQLAEVYARAAQVFDSSLYRRALTRTLDYVLREMTSADGAFLSAQDAEVNHREGQNYLWTREQFMSILGPDDGVFAARVYGLDSGPNFRDPHHADDPPANVLFLADRPAALAAAIGQSEQDFLGRLDRINARLYEARAKRDQPSTDDKVLCGWNGLMIAGLAAGGAALKRPDWIAAAARAADFILAHMRTSDGSLLRSSRAGKAGIPAFLEDYALLVHGLIELHRAGNDAAGRHLRSAEELVAAADRLFADGSGGWFDTLADQSDLFVRARSVYDGAIPSGCSVMLNNLIDLHQITGKPAQLDRALAGLRSVSGFVAQTPLGAANSTRALLRLLSVAPARLRALFEDAPSPAARAADDQPNPVEILAASEHVEVAKDKPGGVVLRFRIAAGYHINAADPGDGPDAEGLIPLSVRIINGTGAAAFADYPKGETFGDGGRLRVYRGQFELPVLIERSGEWSGKPLLAVTYQACTDTECLRPRTVELDISIDRK